MNWQKVKLDEIIDIIGGGTPKTSIKDYWNGGIPWLSVVDFNNSSRYVYTTEKHITEEGLKNSSTKILKKGQIIISARGTVGELAQLFCDMAFNQSCYGLNGKTSYIGNDFLYYLLKYKISKLKLLTHGAVFDTITRNTFNNLEILLPPLAEQEKIASILSALDDKIEVNNKINKNLEEQAQALFKSWFDKGKHEKALLSEIADIKYGKNLPTTQLIEKGYSVFGGNGVIGYFSEFLYELSQILISCRGAASGSILESTPYSFVTNNSLVVELHNRNYYEIIKHYLFLNPLYSYVTGSAQPQITIDSLKTLEVPYPKVEDIKDLSNILNNFYKIQYSNSLENEKLASIRDSLLPKLLSGEIRV